MGIVIELQREALEDNISIESLMRKAYLVARKLNLTEFEEWINQEQNGYKGQVPEYRYIVGEIKRGIRIMVGCQWFYLRI